MPRPTLTSAEKLATLLGWTYTPSADGVDKIFEYNRDGSVYRFQRTPRFVIQLVSTGPAVTFPTFSTNADCAAFETALDAAGLFEDEYRRELRNACVAAGIGSQEKSSFWFATFATPAQRMAAAVLVARKKGLL